MYTASKMLQVYLNKYQTIINLSAARALTMLVGFEMVMPQFPTVYFGDWTNLENVENMSQ